MNKEDKEWQDLNEGLEAIFIISEFEKVCGEIPKHRIKIFAHYNIGQWIERLEIFKKGYGVGCKRTMKYIIGSGWLKKDCEDKLREKMKE